jgi:hypothetical protein
VKHDNIPETLNSPAQARANSHDTGNPAGIYPGVGPTFTLSVDLLGTEVYRGALLAVREHLHGLGRNEAMLAVNAAIADLQDWGAAKRLRQGD